MLGVAISPLAMPILAGPGTIATAMSFVAAGGPEELAITIAAFGALCLITYFVFASGDRITKLLGKDAINVVTHMMGLILAVIGVQMILQGLHGAKALF